MNPATQTLPDVKTIRLARLELSYDTTVLAPRPWTVAQGVWAAELSATAPMGPILELCAGIGHIGLIAAIETGRKLVQVDSSARACHFASGNAANAGVEHLVEVRCTSVLGALDGEERFPLIIADPPYLSSSDTERFPEDPPHTIDGGPDGLSLARECLAVMASALIPGGAGLLQLAGPPQVDRIRRELPEGLVVEEARRYGPDRAVVLLRRGPVTPGPGGNER